MKPGKVYEPGDDPPPSTGTPPPPPKSSAPPGQASDLKIISSEEGVPVALVYGWMRKTGQVIERYVSQLATTAAPTWYPGIAKVLGDLIYNAGNFYVCITAGTTASSGSGPTTTGSDITDGTVHWASSTSGYRHDIVLGFSEGEIYGTGKAWVDKKRYASVSAIPHEAFWIQFFNGVDTGLVTRPNWFPYDAADARYPYTACLFAVVLSGSDSDLPSVSIEEKGIFGDPGHADANGNVNPADIALDILTHARRGAGQPSTSVDAASVGLGAQSYRTYATAAGLRLAWRIESQRSALDLLGQILAASNTDAVPTNRSDGNGMALKFVPLGDQPITANGVTYTPDPTPVVALDAARDLLAPAQFIRISSTDTFNSLPVEFLSRDRDYARVAVDDPVMEDVDLRKLKRGPTLVLDGMAMDPDSAVMLSRIRAQRSLGVRNQLVAKLPLRFIRLEPTDVFTYTDSLIGIADMPFRIISVEEDQDGDGAIIVTAEDWPAAVAHAAKYTPAGGDGYKPDTLTAIQNLGSVGISAVDQAARDAAAALAATLQNLTADNKLSPAEKAPFLILYKDLATGKAAFDSTADSYGVSRVAYDTSVSALIGYMVSIGLQLGGSVDAGPSTEATWLTGTTDIDGPTLRQRFNDAYAARTALQQALNDSLKSVVDSVKFRLPLTIAWDDFNVKNWRISVPQTDTTTYTQGDASYGQPLPTPFGDGG